MEDNAKKFESLLDSATEYGKTSLILVKYRVLDKISDVASSLIANSLVLVFVASFLLFFNLGLAFWLGDILGKIYFGFLIVAAFYGLIALVLHFLMHNRIKKFISDCIIKQALK